jgi:succinyl-diaminopimelate desuccinylase
VGLTADEEGPSINGTAKVVEWMRQRGELPEACVVGEPTCTNALGDEIKIGRRGSLNCEIVVAGKQGHAAYPHLADNPVPKLVRLLDRLCSTPLDSGSERFEPSRVEVTILSAPNRAINVIPAWAAATANIRYNDLWSRPKIEAWVRGVLKGAAAEVGAQYTAEFSGTGDVFLTHPGPLVDAFAEVVREVTGIAPRLSTAGGTSDARFIHSLCPVIEFGLVNATIHQVDERVEVEPLRTLARVYERFIERFLSQGPK